MGHHAWSGESCSIIFITNCVVWLVDICLFEQAHVGIPLPCADLSAASSVTAPPAPLVQFGPVARIVMREPPRPLERPRLATNKTGTPYAYTTPETKAYKVSLSHSYDYWLRLLP